MPVTISKIDRTRKDRKDRTTKAFREHRSRLLRSIASKGVLTPVKLLPIGDRYEIVAGITRLDICLELGIEEIPADILPANLTESQLLSLELADNDLQYGFDVLAQCEAYHDLMTLNGWTAAELSRNEPAATQASISKYLSIRERLADAMKTRLKDGDFGFRIAYALSRHPADAQDGLFEKVKHMKVTCAEDHLNEALGNKPKGKGKGKTVKVTIPGMALAFTVTELAKVRALWEQVNAALKKLEQTGFSLDNLPGLIKP